MAYLQLLPTLKLERTRFEIATAVVPYGWPCAELPCPALPIHLLTECSIVLSTVNRPQCNAHQSSIARFLGATATPALAVIQEQCQQVFVYRLLFHKCCFYRVELSMLAALQSSVVTMPLVVHEFLQQYSEHKPQTL